MRLPLLALLSLLGFSCSSSAPPAVVDLEADWSAWGASNNENFGHRAMGAGDVDGDGFDDLLVAAPGFDSARGRVFLYRGSPGGLSEKPVWSAAGESRGEQFGDRAGQAGDVNGDGFADVFVSEPSWKAGLGRVVVYHGSPSGLGAAFAWSYSPARSTQEQFGDCTHPTGDVNGDGFDDLLVGAYGSDGFRGRVLLFLGSAQGLSREPIWIGEGEAKKDQYGYSLGTAGDVDGDGYGDVLVGAKYHSGAHAGGGKAYLYRGGAVWRGTPAWTAEGREEGAKFAERAHGIGDFDGDGFGDVLVGAPGGNYVAGFRGGRSGLSRKPAWVLEGKHFGLRLFGHGAAPTGDFDGDSRPEFQVYGADEGGTGQVLVFSMAARDRAPILRYRLKGSAGNSRFGSWNAPAGDVNGDGLADFIATDAGASTKVNLGGAVWVVYGRGTPGGAERNRWKVYFPPKKP